MAERARDEDYGLDVCSEHGSRHPIQTSACPVCGGGDAVPRFRVATVASPVVVCAGCGLGRFLPMPSPQQVASWYPESYYGDPGNKFRTPVEKLVRMVGARHIGFLSRGLVAGDRVLDLGCGRGVILGPLADRGFEVHGVEISERAARGADPRADVRLVDSLVEARYPDSFFREVVVWHVLEHLPEPRETLEEIQRILAPGGRLVVAVPNFESLQARCFGAAWFHLDLPRHLYHFPLSALLRLLDETGFEVESEHHFSLRQNPFGWIQSLLNRSHRLPRNGLYQLLHRGPQARLSPGMRALHYALLAGLAPLALGLCLLETLLRSGATVHVVARRV